MTPRKKRTETVIQCTKCGQTDPTISCRELTLTDTQGDRSAHVTLCPACFQMFWLIYDGFVQTRPAVKPAHIIRPPAGFRAAFGYHMERHSEAIQELKKEVTWHRQAIRYLRKMPPELCAPHPRP
jgi:hypothetical protein